MISKSKWSLRVILGISCRKMKKGSMDLFQDTNSKTNWSIFRLLPASLPRPYQQPTKRHLKSIYSLPQNCFQCCWTFLQHISLQKLFRQGELEENVKPWHRGGMLENIPRIHRAKLSRALRWQRFLPACDLC